MAGEYDKLFDQLFARLDQQDEKLNSLNTSVASLLQSRSFMRGVWKAASVVGAIAATVVTVLIEFLKTRGH